MKQVYLSSIIYILFWSLSSSAYANVSWVTDFKAALVEAEAEKKHILVNFTGSDWCGWCIKLDKEVFSKPDFKEYAAQKLVLVEIDFPRQQQDEALKKQNEELAERYGIRGFPTILLLDSNGSLIDRTGYREGGAGAYVTHIKEMLENEPDN